MMLPESEPKRPRGRPKGQRSSDRTKLLQIRVTPETYEKSKAVGADRIIEFIDASPAESPYRSQRR